MRRHLLLPALLASTLALAACGQASDPPDGSVDVAAPASGTPTTEPTSDPVRSEDPTTTAATPATATPASADCTAATLPASEPDLDDLADAAAGTARFLLDAARRCDEPLLVGAATESETSLSFGVVDPSTALGLPGADDAYTAVVRLLEQTSWAAQADDARPATFVWPRVATGDWADDDGAWQEAVDAGLLTAAQAQEQRAAGSGYLGWRLGITGDGDWQFLVAGD